MVQRNCRPRSAGRRAGRSTMVKTSKRVGLRRGTTTAESLVPFVLAGRGPETTTRRHRHGAKCWSRHHCPLARSARNHTCQAGHSVQPHERSQQEAVLRVARTGQPYVCSSACPLTGTAQPAAVGDRRGSALFWHREAFQLWHGIFTNGVALRQRKGGLMAAHATQKRCE